MTRKKASPAAGKHRSKHSKRSRSRSPLPENLDAFVPLSSLISDHETLALAAVSFVGWKNVESMLPPCLQGRSREDVVQLISDELDGMSKRRISCILEGENVPSSSSSSEVSEEDEQSEACQEHHSNETSTSSPDDQVRNTSSSESEVFSNKLEQEQFSDLELVEGLDADSANLPEVGEP